MPEERVCLSDNVTDRNDLDGTFSACNDLLRQTPEQATDRDDLRRRLTRTSGGVIFNTVQKFMPPNSSGADHDGVLPPLTTCPFCPTNSLQQMERKNLALEALRKLLNGELKSRTKSNVVETRRFSERLDAAVARYHANGLSTVEVIQELIKLAQDISAAAKRGDAEGFSTEELAFYDALVDNGSAVDVMSDAQLR
jgi:type I site-specific restriction-modification system R (restriction) subunit